MHGIYLTQEQARYMAQHDVRLVPTLSTIANMAAKGPEWGLPAEWITIAERTVQVHRESFQHALDAGVVFGVGTDGYGSVVDELRAFVSFGLSPMRALQAATRDSALIARPGWGAGVLAEGRPADVIVVEGDPLAALDALESVVAVMADGRLRHDPAGTSAGPAPSV